MRYDLWLGTLALLLPWCYRFVTRPLETAQDILVIGVFVIYKHWESLAHWLHNHGLVPLCDAETTLFALSTLLVLLILLWSLSAQSREEQLISWPQPMLFPCRTNHTRLFPKKHSFSYSYLLVGIPIGWTGSAGSILSAENKTTARKTRTWFSVEAEDYLARGPDPKGLIWKLWTFLRSHGLSPQDFGHAYLVTAPRFLGYSFNPVSFWYLYDRNRNLAAMILEVNNTFDERRMYLLKPQTRGRSTGASDGEVIISQTWEKDFHVSPFNDRDGFYSLKATDPFIPGQTPKINCIITLMAKDQRPKLVARIYSTRDPSLPASMNRFQSLWFVLKWGWVGLTTDLRILREARKLWSKGLKVFYRPEVLKSSIGRSATPEEEILEMLFRSWIDRIPTIMSNDIVIDYVAAVNSAVSVSLGTSENEAGNIKNRQRLTFRVLSPSFYRSLIYYESITNAIEAALSESSASDRLLWVSDATLLRQVVNKVKPEPHLCSVSKSSALSSPYCQNMGAGISLLVNLANGNALASSIELREFAQARFPDPRAFQQYQNAVRKIVLSDTFALGSTRLFHSYWVLISVALLFLNYLGIHEVSDLVFQADNNKGDHQLVWKLLLATFIHLAHFAFI